MRQHLPPTKSPSDISLGTSRKQLFNLASLLLLSFTPIFLLLSLQEISNHHQQSCSPGNTFANFDFFFRGIHVGGYVLVLNSNKQTFTVFQFLSKKKTVVFLSFESRNTIPFIVITFIWSTVLLLCIQNITSLLNEKRQ